MKCRSWVLMTFVNAEVCMYVCMYTLEASNRGTCMSVTDLSNNTVFVAVS